MARFLLAFLTLAPLGAQTILLTRGASECQVFQRDSEGFAVLDLQGQAFNQEGKAVEARLVKDGQPLDGFDWRGIAAVKGRQWGGKVERVPTGGPYRLEVRVEGSRDLSSASHLLVGDLWILAGQSNMEGLGNLENLPEPSPLVNSFDMTDKWGEARDPLHRLVDAVNRVHWRRNAQGQPEKMEGSRLDQYITTRVKGAGVGLPFALEMVRRTGVPIGLVPCAHGGTSMDQWSPALKERGGDSLYGGMLRRFQAVGGKVKGVLWYQGESDANPKAAPLFAEKFKALIAASRSDFGQPELPWYHVQIGRHVNTGNIVEWNAVQEAQRRIEEQAPGVGMTTCADCELDDGIHVSTGDYRELGLRLANLACHDLYPSKAGCANYRKGPRPVSARLSGGVVTVEFAEVNGRLTHAGRLSGFSLHGADGAPLTAIYRQRIDPANPFAVQLFVQGKLAPQATLRYGYGKDPLLNLRDAAGMAAPVFGPFPIEQ
jgi:sialate O-acetylesterase